MEAPILAHDIPAQVVNERAAFGPFDLKDFITSEFDPNIRFSAELKNGDALPKGMICTSDGLLTGIPAKDTKGNYQIVVTAENANGMIKAEFLLTIKPSLATGTTDYMDQLKAQIWEAVDQRLPVPDLSELYDRPITAIDIYYLLERWGILQVWDAFNLEPPGELVLLKLEGASEHYNVYDRGSCIVACPKDLFSHERTIEDGLRTARAVAKELYKRQWTIELTGFDKMVRAAWVELQHLADIHGKQLEIINFEPTINDIKLYHSETQDLRLRRLEN